jgi:hypothetical protein
MQTQTEMEQTLALLGAMADAGRRADEAMRAGRVSYDPRVGFARRNLLERWFGYRALMSMHPRPEEAVRSARKLLRHAIRVYRRMNIAETRGIDTSVNGWRVEGKVRIEMVKPTAEEEP